MTVDLRQLPFAASVPGVVRRVFRDAQLVHEDIEVERAVDRVAIRLTVDMQDQNPVLVGVLPAAMVFAGMLLRRLVFPLQFTSVSIDVDGKINAAPGALDLLRQHPVIVVDSGLQTERLKSLQEWLHAAAVTSIRLAVLLEPRDLDACEVSYAALPAHESALFGCGLDFQGYGANLPGIYTATEGQSEAAT